ncbi:hypothetical protein Tco_1124576 [Tanacetum coccineum]|uniref:Uncharacterized protein n=1 Tax=Tanacetum coccineum TaxID=301880 RepID=A0ABQ5J769_9ASTR
MIAANWVTEGGGLVRVGMNTRVPYLYLNSSEVWRSKQSRVEVLDVVGASAAEVAKEGSIGFDFCRKGQSRCKEGTMDDNGDGVAVVYDDGVAAAVAAGGGGKKCEWGRVV